MSHARRDVIEDSEPERERVRLESRRRRKQERSEVAKGITDWPQQEEPIIISSNCTTPVDEAPATPVDEDSAQGAAPGPADCSSDVIIIEDSDEGSQDDMRHHLSGFRFASTLPVSRHGSAKLAHSVPQRQVSGASSSSPSSSSFPLIRDPPVSTVQPQTVTIEAAPKKRATRRPDTFPCLTALSDARLAKLSRCVSCELKWTTRKTVVEKVKHVSTCAKKHGLEDATLSALIEKELGQDAPARPSLKKGPLKLPTDGPHSPKTLLAHVRQVEEPKKGRKPPFIGSVQNPETAASIIRTRAREVLGLGGSGRPSSPPRLTVSGIRFLSKEVIAGPAAAATELPSTQPFRKSALAVGQSKQLGFPSSTTRRSLFITDDGPGSPTHTCDTDAVIPATQVFAPSALANRHLAGSDAGHLDAGRPAPPRFVLEEDLENVDSSKGDPSFSPGRQVVGRRSSSTRPSADDMPPSPYASTSVNALAPVVGALASILGPSRSPVRHEEDVPTSAWPLLRVDDHLHPSSNSRLSPVQHSLRWEDDLASYWDTELPFTLPEDLKRPHENLDGVPLLAPDVEGAVPSPHKRVKRAGTARKKKDAPDPAFSDAELETKMLELIRADETLLLRVLRYEPIDFEVFLQLARDAGFADRGLKLVVKPFLDKHAIQFYGAEGTIGRSRVKKQALTQSMAMT